MKRARTNENSVPLINTTNVPTTNARGNQVLNENRSNSFNRHTPHYIKTYCARIINGLLLKAAEKNVPVKAQMLRSIQELIDGKIEVSTFFQRSNKLLDIKQDANCHIFFKSSIQLLREALVKGEVNFPGIRPPQMVVPAQLPKTIPNRSRYMPPRPIMLNAAGQPTTAKFAPRMHQNVIRAPNPDNIQRFMKNPQPAFDNTFKAPKYIIPGAAQLLPQYRGKVPAITGLANGSNMIDAEKTVPSKAAAAAKVSKQRIIENHPLQKDYAAEGVDQLVDTAAMAGINFSEEYLAGTEEIGTQERTIKETPFLILPLLLARFKERIDIVIEKDALLMISQATEEHLKNIIQSLTTVVDLRMLDLSNDPIYERDDEFKCQVQFIADVERSQDKIRRELEREELLRIVNSRSRTDNPERARIRARAIEIQRAEIADLHQRNANLTALEATGPRKKISTDNNNAEKKAVRRSLRRANLRDIMFFLQNNALYQRSAILSFAYLR